jgi:hypothetical protein
MMPEMKHFVVRGHRMARPEVRRAMRARRVYRRVCYIGSAAIFPGVRKR